MRRAALSPFVFPAALGGTAFAVGGLPGFLLGFLAALLGIDRALGFAGVSRIEAERAYRRLVRGRSGPPLEYLPDDVGWAAVAPHRRIGVQTIAIDSIIGTSDRHKAESFDVAFRPPEWSRERWIQMWLAARRGALPPISVYRVGDRHFVRDGHHRVSVARAHGATSIEASVVELGAAGQRAA